MAQRGARTAGRGRRQSGRGGWRWAAWFALVSLLLNLLVPLAVVAEAAPAESDTFICHAAPVGHAGAPATPLSHSAAHHCPLCLLLSGSSAVPTVVGTFAILPPPPVFIRPHPAVPAPPPVSARLIIPESRAPPSA